MIQEDGAQSGNIKVLKPHPNADKLMVLQIDLVRTATDLRGIRNHYAPEELSADKSWWLPT